MTDLKHEAGEIRARWKADAGAAVASLMNRQLARIHGELGSEFSAADQEYQDVLIYIDAIRAEYHKRFGSAA
jgi:hypothetical protein